MQITRCSSRDIHELAVLNKRLIEDEKSDNPMGIPELEERMNTFLSGDYDAYFFAEAGKTIGYALVRRTSSPLYLRQFFIDRDETGDLTEAQVALPLPALRHLL